METEHNADLVRDCCPFKTTPGRLAGQWTNCPHGWAGRLHELQLIVRAILSSANTTPGVRTAARVALADARDALAEAEAALNEF